MFNDGEEVLKRSSHFWRYFVGGIFLFVILGAVVFIQFPFSEEKISTCGDSSFYETCSLSKPYFCSQGKLVPRASICGCPNNFTKQGDECFFSRANKTYVELNYSFEGIDSQISLNLEEEVGVYLSKLPRSLFYSGKEIPRRDDFKLMKIDDSVQEKALMPLVVEIQNLAPTSKQDQAKIAISLVQNIDYKESEFQEIFGGKASLRVARYPYQVLLEEVGSCEGKSELLLFLLRKIGYGTVVFYFKEENHEAVGIKCPVSESYLGSGYCFVETTFPAPISYSEGVYLGDSGPQQLLSKPEIILISEGLSLDEDLEDYSLAKNFQLF